LCENLECLEKVMYQTRLLQPLIKDWWHPAYFPTFLYKTVVSGGRLVAGFPPRRPGFQPGLRHVGFVVNRVAMEQVFSEDFNFPVNLHSTICSTVPIICHLGLVKRPIVAALPSGLSFTPLRII
jgi:hypothetical protein